MMERLTPPPDNTIERMPEPCELFIPDRGLCDRCRRSGVQIARVDGAGCTVCIECEEEGNEQ